MSLKNEHNYGILYYIIKGCDKIMNKKIIIDSEDAEVKKVERIDNYPKKTNKKIINNGPIEWLIYMIGYAIVLLVVSKLFNSLYINTSYLGIYALLASIIIYILNQTLKPLINYITLPLTILSYGLLYPITNVIILYLTSFILGKNFVIKGFIPAFIIAIFISFLNILMEGLIIKPIINRKNGLNE